MARLPAPAAFALGLSTLSTLSAVSCGPPSRPSPSGSSPDVKTEPSSSLDSVPSVVRLHVTGIAASAASALLLVEGELTSYYVSRLRAGEIPSTLLVRRIDAVAWSDPRAEDVVLAPSVPLVPGETYSLAALGRGPLATLVVDPDAAPVAERIWPPRSAVHAGSRSVFCAASVATFAQLTVWLDPVGWDATATLGTDGAGSSSDHCVHLDAALPLPTGVAVPPPAIGDAAMDPAPLALDPESSLVKTLSCAAGEVPVGPGCAVVMDDRAIIRSAGAALLWSLRVSDQVRIEPAPVNGSFVVTGLTPSSNVSVRGTVTDLAGLEQSFAAVFVTGAPRPHVVINEVLANPLGPEPAQEWVELVNDGASPVDVGGFLLSDSGGNTVLPRAVLDPGEFALVVGQAFEVSDGQDVPPLAGTLLLRVPHVGSAGLSNSGEALHLSTADGQRISSFPAVPAVTPGVSIVRRIASALDDDPNAFFPSTDGSASPGWENHIASPE